MTQEIDIAVIKNQVDEIKKWINNADINHFPTIEGRFDKLEKKLAFYSGGITVAIFLVNIIMRFID